MEYFKKCKLLIDYDAVEFTGGVESSEIDNAEKKLNMKFPKSYKEFLLQFGAGDIGGEVIFGITKKKNSDIDMVKITKMEHDYKMPKYMIVINYNASSDSLVCLDTSKFEQEECPVVSVPNDYKDIRFVANSFGEFLFNLLTEE